MIQKNLIKQDFKVFQLFQKLFSEVTEFKINKQKNFSSMSKPDNPNDNAIIENFFSIFKGYIEKPTIYKLERFTKFYNNNLILSKLNNQTTIGFLSKNEMYIPSLKTNLSQN